MPRFYLDTSALVKLYIEEQGTRKLLDLTVDAQPGAIVILELAKVEFRAAVRRREREGVVSRELATEIVSDFGGHWESLYLIQPVTTAVVEVAAALVDRHPLRAYDAFQLAGTMIFRQMLPGEDITFVCADKALVGAAAAEGLNVFDPLAGKADST